MRKDLNNLVARSIEQKNENLKRYLQDRIITMRELIDILKDRDELESSSRFSYLIFSPWYIPSYNFSASFSSLKNINCIRRAFRLIFIPSGLWTINKL